MKCCLIWDIIHTCAHNIFLDLAHLYFDIGQARSATKSNEFLWRAVQTPRTHTHYGLLPSIQVCQHTWYVSVRKWRMFPHSATHTVYNSWSMFFVFFCRRTSLFFSLHQFNLETHLNHIWLHPTAITGRQKTQSWSWKRQAIQSYNRKAPTPHQLEWIQISWKNKFRLPRSYYRRHTVAR